MDRMNGAVVIKQLRSRWIIIAVGARTITALAFSFLLTELFHTLVNTSYWWFLVFFAGFLTISFFIRPPWRLKESSIAQLLDQQYPSIEESAGLLLEVPSSLNSLQTLQYKRANDALINIPSPLQLPGKLVNPVLIFVLSLLATSALQLLPSPRKDHIAPLHQASPAPVQREAMLPEVAAMNVTIKPPAYTRKPLRQQHAFNIIAEQGAVVNWQVQTNFPARNVVFLFNDRLRVRLQSSGSGGTSWQFSGKTDSTSFYQLSIDGKRSEFYKIEVIKDAPPVITVQSPKQYTTVDIGMPQQVNITTSISDDYGLTNAIIIATIASGSGEAVKFKEQKIGLTGFMPGKTVYHLQQSLLLPSLGMQAGDELYFYIEATDNNHNQSRSDVYIVHLPDTAQLMSLEGLGNSLTLKPEYFRSQRQIIIETEQLLKEKDTISEEAFKTRSNNLGIDQKLLRLRYSKFLGDENEPGENNIDELTAIADFSNAEKLKDAFTDKHDNAEDASYFEPGTKKQLQATLSEMWNAEIRLRTLTPKAALPFEYKALRLLKDLQQQSRAYVAKASYKTTPLDLKKRLTGDLSKIAPTVLQKEIKQQSDADDVIRMALSVLDSLKTTGPTPYAYVGMLQQANLRLHEKAIQQPGIYLAALEALKRVINNINSSQSAAVKDITIAEYGLAQLLRSPLKNPAAKPAHSAQALSHQYFDNLQKLQP